MIETTYMDIYDDTLLITFIYCRCFLHGTYHQIKKYSAFTTNLLKKLFLLTLLKFCFVHCHELILILKKSKFFFFYHEGNPSFREFEYQDTTPRFTRLIPLNVCV